MSGRNIPLNASREHTSPLVLDCEVCGRSGPALKHPCRFEIACNCWRGRPCKGTGKVSAERV